MSKLKLEGRSTLFLCAGGSPHLSNAPFSMHAPIPTSKFLLLMSNLLWQSSRYQALCSVMEPQTELPNFQRGTKCAVVKYHPFRNRVSSKSHQNVSTVNVFLRLKFRFPASTSLPSHPRPHRGPCACCQRDPSLGQGCCRSSPRRPESQPLCSRCLGC